jgi:hypothetical protein
MSDRTPQGLISDNLTAELDLFAKFQGNHTFLASEANDPEIKHLHDELIDLIEQIQVIEKQLLDEYYLPLGKLQCEKDNAAV